MPTNPCSRCGQHHTKCTAHTRAGNPCNQNPQPDQTVCHLHGGRSPQALDGADRRRQERAALTAAETFGLPVIVDPHTALLDELHRTVGAVQWLGAVVADLDRADVAWGRTRDKQGGDDAGTTYEARPNAFVALWQSERAHLVKVSAACVAAGIEERRVRLAEQQGALIATVIRGVLDRLDLTPAQLEQAPTIVAEQLRLTAAEQDTP